ncbi:hypothetical protein BO78DRAFT_399244 [Aspergillus sclerotiicarbonarius CBS 121057]|uniref:Secreted protein n=1 Tax=Aspergillus sclerotiicarbonarius (strain CBS 121057 / IBT 28362) TaxID=1448318 RepID=A0A319E7D5_ASPSB|nr:hypothetical protein BO78DRAFT_399244 [Aspergillus sclerotiicarbonarius CBS 121057]
MLLSPPLFILVLCNDASASRISRSHAVFLPYPESNSMIARLPEWRVTTVKDAACMCSTYTLRQYHLPWDLASASRCVRTN